MAERRIRYGMGDGAVRTPKRSLARRLAPFAAALAIGGLAAAGCQLLSEVDRNKLNIPPIPGTGGNNTGGTVITGGGGAGGTTTTGGSGGTGGSTTTGGNGGTGGSAGSGGVAGFGGFAGSGGTGGVAGSGGSGGGTGSGGSGGTGGAGGSGGGPVVVCSSAQVCPGVTGHTFYKYGTPQYQGDTDVCGYLVRYINPEATGAKMEIRCTADGEQSTVLAVVIFEAVEKTDPITDGYVMRNVATQWGGWDADGNASVE